MYESTFAVCDCRIHRSHRSLYR